MREIWSIRRIPEIYLVILYLILKGLTVPSFGDFWYYYMTNIRNFSQIQYGYLGIVGNISLLIGSVLYSRFFKNFEFRYILAFSNVIVFVGAVVGLIIILDMHKALGMTDF